MNPSRFELARAALTAALIAAACGVASADPITLNDPYHWLENRSTNTLGRVPGLRQIGGLALGSAARHEQALHTDQDHALAYEPQGRPVEDVDPYFAELAEFVTAALEDAGIHRCKGDAMASNQAMRRSVQGWVDAFRGWMRDPGRSGSILSSIVYDFRKEAEVHRLEFRGPDLQGDWIARAVPAFRIGGYTLATGQDAVRLTATDAGGKIAIDQIFVPRAHQ